MPKKIADIVSKQTRTKIKETKIVEEHARGVSIPYPSPTPEVTAPVATVPSVPQPEPEKEIGPKILKMEEVTGRLREKLSPQDQFLASLAKAKIPSQTPPPPPREEVTLQFPESAKPRRSRSKLFLFGIVAILSLTAGFFFFSVSISRAHLELKAVKDFQAFDFSVNLRQNPTPQETSQGALPLQKIQNTAEHSKEYAATGEGDVTSKAHGKILIYNEYNTQPQVLVEKTRLLSSDGKLFRLTSRIVVPSAKSVGGKLEPSYIEADVIADEAGREYNIEPTRFTIPGFQGSPRYEKFYGVSKEKFTGGARGKGKIVLAEDIQKAQEDLSNATFEELRSRLNDELPGGIKLIAEASQIKVAKLESSAKPGDGGDTFRVSISAELSALIFDELYIKDLVSKKFSGEEANELSKPIYDMTYEVKRADYANGELTLRVHGARNIGASIDTLALKRDLLGKNADEVKKKILSLEGVEEAKVKFWPFWVRRIPAKIDRLTIVVK